MYAKLAFTGIRKNMRTYLPYILACSGMAMMSYIMAFLNTDNSIIIWTGNTLGFILKAGMIVLTIFSAIFLFYTNSFLIKNRKTEFGLYNILGMGKREVACVLIWETLIIYGASMLAGIGTGILFSKLAELFLANMSGMETGYDFSVSFFAIAAVLIIFAVIFFLILLNSLRQIHFSKPIELLRSKSVGEKPPKANFLTALLGLLILGVAYYIALTIDDPFKAIFTFFIAVIMVIAATYMLFIAGSVTVCRLLQRKKSYYYKTNHFLSVSQMAHRMKRNGAGLASICILSTMVLVTFSSTACLYFGIEGMIKKEFPRSYIVMLRAFGFDENAAAAENGITVVDRVLEENSLTARGGFVLNDYLEVGCAAVGDTIVFDRKMTDGISFDVCTLVVMPVSEYNEVMAKNEGLGDGEALIYRTDGAECKELTINGYGSFKVKKQVETYTELGSAVRAVVPRIYLFVKDRQTVRELFDYQNKVYGDHASSMRNFYCFDLDCPASEKETMRNRINRGLNSFNQETEERLLFMTESDDYTGKNMRQLFGGLFFLGITLGGAFLCAAVMIIYYKQISEGYEDKEKFMTLQQVGMTEREIRSSVNSQVLTVFFLPPAAAGIHTLFAFPLTAKLLALFGMTDRLMFGLVCLSCFGIFTAVYIAVYLLTSGVYLRIVNAKYR